MSANRQGQGGPGGPVRFPPPLIYISGLLLSIGIERIISTPDLPPPLAIVSGAAAVLALALLDARATALFLKKKTGIAPWHAATALVSDGPYRFTRNPMYLGMALAYMGVALGFGLLWAFVFLPLVLAIVDRAVIRREEIYLEEKFGEDYCVYKRAVRRWI